MNEDDGPGPLLLAPPGYLELRVRLREAMGFPDHRQPLLIGIDGVDGSKARNQSAEGRDCRGHHVTACAQSHRSHTCFYVLIDRENHEAGMRDRLEPYFRAYQPKERANFVLRWSSASHDARVLGAHHARHGR